MRSDPRSRFTSWGNSMRHPSRSIRSKQFISSVIAAVESLESRQMLSAGELDPAFGTGGIVTLGGTLGLNATVCGPGGSIVAVGFFEPADPNLPVTFGLTRYNSNGKLDGTFGSGGVVKSSLPSDLTPFDATTAVTTPSGQIVVVGTGGNGIRVGRFNANGRLDPTFNGDGFNDQVITGAYDVPSVIVQNDGKIIVSVLIEPGDSELLRFDKNGALDTNFGNGGVLVTPIQVFALSLAKGGKIVAGGATDADPTTGLHSAFAVARYLSDGSLDPTFGAGTGMVSTSFGTDDQYANSVLVASNGDIVLAGSAGTIVAGNLVPQYQFSLVRYLPDGTLDSSFGTGGLIQTDISGRADTASLAPGGKILVAGSRLDESGVFTVVRYRSDGQLDSTFGSGGISENNSGVSSNGPISALIVYPNGKFLVCPNATPERFRANGTLDNSYGLHGIAQGSTSFDAQVVQTQKNGQILIAGQGQSGLGIARYNTNGSPDIHFGIAGTNQVTWPASLGTVIDLTAQSIAVASGGKILVLSSFNTSSTTGIMLVEFNSNGSVNTHFGTGGIVIPSGTNLYGGSVALQSDGKILVVGNDNTIGSALTADSAFEIFRYRANGSLDPTFGSGGIITDLAGQTAGADAILITRTRQIVVAGQANGMFTAIRYTANGVRDQSFGVDGVVSTSFADITNTGQGSDSAVPPTSNALVLTATTGGGQGGLQIIGSALDVADHSAVNYIAIANYNSAGLLQNRSVALEQVGPQYARAKDGQLVFASGSGSVTRYNADGSVDTSFGTNGTATFAPSDGFTQVGVPSVAVLPDGDVIALQGGLIARFFGSSKK
jgi:uncharacterized delta-60 repeat protein